ncbi:Ribosomal protein L7Ae/L30e/S12e/Gadd45 [Penicillium cf. griseofulvum]|nr:Ribosomal protein L7Ae/L30e/S12e/Gadd45 [Penicillium cf. griseofulvum]KAJ5433834.1 Ribosomal protein L7Ae/L30e/S12e/Gadd45 [Penicillium cf. griseofulvum]
MADAALAQESLDLLQQAMHYDQIKKGANERISEIVVLAADTVPLAILMHLPALCECKNVSYVVVPSKHAISRACGMSRPISAANIDSNDASDLVQRIEQTRNKVEQLAIQWIAVKGQMEMDH